MEKDLNEKVIEIELSYSVLTLKISKIGGDYHILLQGGDKPHIGCTVLAIPRASLKGGGEKSSTASVINVTGHKDEYLCRKLAEKMSAQTGAVVACTGGFHVDNITDGQMEEVIRKVEQIPLG